MWSKYGRSDGNYKSLREVDVRVVVQVCMQSSVYKSSKQGELEVSVSKGINQLQSRIPFIITVLKVFQFAYQTEALNIIVN